MLEWLKRHAWKACIRQNRISGSNPDLSARKSRTPRPGIFFGKTHPLFMQVMQAAEESGRQSHSEVRPSGGIFAVHRPRFCRFFAPDGNLKMPSATLSRENRARLTLFYISTGRTSGNVQPPLHGVIEFRDNEKSMLEKIKC